MIPVTALASYDYCPRKLYLENILKIGSKDRKAMVRGSLYHQCMDSFTKAEQGLVMSIARDEPYPLVAQRFVTYAKEVVSSQISAFKHTLVQEGHDLDALHQEVLQTMHNEARRRARDIFSFIEQHDDLLYGELLWSHLSPKLKQEQRYDAEELGIRGRIDCLLVYEEGKIIPVEYKTGKAPADGVWPGHRLQVAAYVIMVEHLVGATVPYGVVRYLDSGIDRKVMVNDFLRSDVKKLAITVKSMLAAEDPPLHVTNQRKCDKCYLKGFCYNEDKVRERMAFIEKASLQGVKISYLMF